MADFHVALLTLHASRDCYEPMMTREVSEGPRITQECGHLEMTETQLNKLPPKQRDLLGIKFEEGPTVPKDSLNSSTVMVHVHFARLGWRPISLSADGLPRVQPEQAALVPDLRFHCNM